MPSMPAPQTHSAMSRHKNCAANAKTRPFSPLAPSFSAKFAKKRQRLFPVTKTRFNILSREGNPFRKCIATSRQFDPKRYPVDTLPAAATVACSERNRKPSMPIVDEIHRVLANMRIPRPWRDPLAAGRLLLLSTFADSIRRPTAATAPRRNACVAANAAYAAPISNEHLYRALDDWPCLFTACQGADFLCLFGASHHCSDFHERSFPFRMQQAAATDRAVSSEPAPATRFQLSAGSPQTPIQAGPRPQAMTPPGCAVQPPGGREPTTSLCRSSNPRNIDL